MRFYKNYEYISQFLFSVSNQVSSPHNAHFTLPELINITRVTMILLHLPHKELNNEKSDVRQESLDTNQPPTH